MSQVEKQGKIQFVNHSSVWIGDNQIGLLTDPWCFGSAFDYGWSLIYENTDAEITELLNKTNYIWYSHEHPDHFSIAFLKKYQELIKKNKIQFIFQYTKDKRVVSFLKSLDFEVTELKSNQELTLTDDFKIKIEPVAFFDSALIVRINKQTLFHINDCLISNSVVASKFLKKHGTCDVLLTQFSYAAWRGGKDNLEWRQRGAEAKVKFSQLQNEYFKPKAIIAFASFVYFSNELNFYMNDSINTPEDFIRKFNQPLNLNVPIIFMQPGESQTIDKLCLNKDSLNFWQELYVKLSERPKLKFPNTHGWAELETKFKMFQERIFKKNSRLLILFFRYIPFINAFRPIKIQLLDFNLLVNCDLLKGMNIITTGTPDVTLHSHSLLNIFDNEFGLDTLAVNSCFETNGMDGFNRFVKLFGINNLNSMGYSFSWTIIFNMDLYLLFFHYLKVARSQRT